MLRRTRTTTASSSSSSSSSPSPRELRCYRLIAGCQPSHDIASMASAPSISSLGSPDTRWSQAPNGPKPKSIYKNLWYPPNKPVQMLSAKIPAAMQPLGRPLQGCGLSVLDSLPFTSEPRRKPFFVPVWSECHIRCKPMLQAVAHLFSATWYDSLLRCT